MIGFLVSQATSQVWGLVLGLLFFLWYRHIELNGDRSNPRHPRYEPPSFAEGLPEADEEHCPDLEAQNRGLLDRVALKVEKQITTTGTGERFDASALSLESVEGST